MDRFWIQIASIKGEAKENEKKLADIGFNSEKIPEKYCCSLGFTIMTDPVYAQGLPQYQFEKAWILRWLETANTHPYTRQPLTQANLIPNEALKIEIEKFVDDVMHEYQGACNTKLT
jgi:hypothetical protein